MGLTAQFLEVAAGELTGGGVLAAGAQAGVDLYSNWGEKDADDLVGQKGFSFLEGRANSIRQYLSSLIALFK